MNTLFETKDWETLGRLPLGERRAILEDGWSTLAREYPGGDFDRLISLGAAFQADRVPVDATVISWATATGTAAAVDVAANVLAGYWGGDPPSDLDLVRAFFALLPRGEKDEQVRYDVFVVAHALATRARDAQIRREGANAVAAATRAGFRNAGLARTVAEASRGG